MDDEPMGPLDGMHETPPGDRHLDEAIAMLRATVAVDAEAFDARVIEAIRRTPPLRLVRTPRARRIIVASAVAAGLAATLLVAVTIRGRNGNSSTEHRAVASRVGAPAVATQVRFRLIHADAARVAVVGSFNAWSATATPLHRVGDSTWVADVTLPAGRYVYQFVIDEHARIPDPDAPLDPADDFGTRNSVVTVLPRSGS